MPPGPTYCGVYGCRINSKTMPHLTFFQLPCAEERRQKWAKQIGRHDLLLEKNIQKRCFVCSIHFKPEMFKNKRLKLYAHPSLHLPAPDSPGGSDESLRLVDTKVDIIKINTPQSQEKQTQTDEEIMIKNQITPTISIAIQTESETSRVKQELAETTSCFTPSTSASSQNSSNSMLRELLTTDKVLIKRHFFPSLQSTKKTMNIIRKKKLKGDRRHSHKKQILEEVEICQTPAPKNPLD